VSRTTEVTAAIEGLIEANRALRVQLLVNEGILTQAVELLNGGAGVGETLMSLPSVSDRRAAEEGVRSLYEARHRVREVLIPAALGEGLELVDIASAFGIPIEAIIGFASQAPSDH
jgi:hypothetical protein